MTRWPGGGGIGLPVALRSGAGGGAGLSPIDGTGLSPIDGALDAAGATGFESGGAAGRGAGGGAMPPVERTTRGRGASATGAGSLGSAAGSGVVDGSAGAGVSTTGAAGASGALGLPRDDGLGLGSGLGSSTIGSPRRSRLSARRRTRSADGSSMLDEWLLTPILSSSARSSTTWFSTPSSRANS